MRFVNCTPHAITIQTQEGDLILPTTRLARVAQAQGKEVVMGGVRVMLPGPWGEVEGLPPPQEGIGLVVSALVGGRMEGSGRGDIFVPGTGPLDGAIRDDQGRIVAVTCLKQVR
jgi:hypothetical protein